MTENLKEQVSDLDFGVEKSMRYHSRMAGRYEVIHKISMFLTIAAGSAAFAEFLSENSMWFGAAAAIFAAYNLVYSPGLNASRHRRLHDKFSDLAIEIRTSEKSQENYNQWIACRLRIEQGEPAIFWALEADCDNEVRRAWNRDSKLAAIGWWFRATMYIFRHTKKFFPPEVNPYYGSDYQKT